MTKKPPSSTTQVKTPEQVLAHLRECGISVSEWSRTHQISRAIVYRVLSGTNRGLRGQGHRAAVLLGLKAGRLDVDASDLVAPNLQRGA